MIRRGKTHHCRGHKLKLLCNQVNHGVGEVASGSMGQAGVHRRYDELQGTRELHNNVHHSCKDRKGEESLVSNALGPGVLEDAAAASLEVKHDGDLLSARYYLTGLQFFLWHQKKPAMRLRARFPLVETPGGRRCLGLGRHHFDPEPCLG